MDRKRRYIASILALLMILVCPCTAYAEEPDGFDAPVSEAPADRAADAGAAAEDEAAGETTDQGGQAPDISGKATEVTVVDSIEELSEESDAEYSNDAFFTIDASGKKTDADLATDEVKEEVSAILSGDDSTSNKQGDIAGALEDSGFYRTEESGKSKVEVTSKFAYQRLRLVAGREKEINAYGATKAVFYDSYYLLSYDSIEATKAAYESLTAEYGPESVLIDMPLKLNDSKETSKGSAKGWGTAYMKMDREKALPEYSGDVTVAVIDTGITRSHEIFNGKNILQGYDVINNDSDPSDDHWHGTAVSGIIAESTPSNVKIMPLKALDENGEGSLEDMINAIIMADNNDADIINISVGGYFDTKSELNYYDAALSQLDAVIVCAAGNENENLDDPWNHEFPAELGCAVSAGSFTEDRKRSDFSNYGSAVDFAAPGSYVLMAMSDGSYNYKSGTSFSSPYIASAAAFLDSKYGRLSSDQIIHSLAGMSEDMGDPGKDVYFGNGCPIFSEGPTDILPKITLSGSSFVYTGSAITPEVTVRFGSRILAEGTDYSLSYANNTEVGTATVTVTCMGDYRGSAHADFTITPVPDVPAAVDPVQTVPSAQAELTDLPKVKISKPSTARKKLTVRWQKPDKKKLKKINGYEIQISGPGYDRIVTAGKSRTSKKIGKLAAKKKYRVRIRAYRYSGGVKHVSAWSGWKKAKTK